MIFPKSRISVSSWWKQGYHLSIIKHNKQRKKYSKHVYGFYLSEMLYMHRKCSFPFGMQAA